MINDHMRVLYHNRELFPAKVLRRHLDMFAST